MNYLLDGGCVGKGQNVNCGLTEDADGGLIGRLKVIEADAAFLFLGFLISIGAAVLYYLASRRNDRGARHSAA